MNCALSFHSIAAVYRDISCNSYHNYSELVGLNFRSNPGNYEMYKARNVIEPVAATLAKAWESKLSLRIPLSGDRGYRFGECLLSRLIDDCGGSA
jgi:hypothetical protein